MRWRTILAIVTTLGGTMIVGCGGAKLIPNTQVNDTAQNRELIGAVEKYRQAMERLDAARVLSLAHSNYRDLGSASERNKDIDHARLTQILKTRFKNVERIRFNVNYQRVTMEGGQAHVDTWVEASFLYKQPDGNQRWQRMSDYNRFSLMKSGKSWLFVAGL